MVLNSKHTERNAMKIYLLIFYLMSPSFSLLPFLIIFPKILHTLMNIDRCVLKFFLNYKMST